MFEVSGLGNRRLDDSEGLISLKIPERRIKLAGDQSSTTESKTTLNVTPLRVNGASQSTISWLS